MSQIWWLPFLVIWKTRCPEKSSTMELKTLHKISFSEKWHLLTSYSLWPHELYIPWNSPGQNTEVGSLSLSRGSSQPRQGSNAGLLHSRWILYQLSQREKLGIFPPKSFKALGWPVGKRRNILAINNKKVKIQRGKPVWWWYLPGGVWPHAEEDRQNHEACKKLRW